MSTGVKITAEPRTEFGKGFARRARKAGLVPAVIYGHGEAPRHISLPAKEFAAALRHGGMTTVFDISVSDGHTTLALPKAIQRDVLKDTFKHVDLIIVKRGEMVTVDVPVQVVGEPARGTLVTVDHDRVSILAEALNLPEHLEASVEGLDAGAHVTAGEIKLPRGVTLATDPETIMVVVAHAPTAEQLEGETAAAAEEGAEGEAEEGAEGEKSEG
ncbi:50S ribosomal protein L25/general stress protein Ctc [Allorhizocola rhizosphaerae]|uniref:50S ribosomal protein L25/general stress protein Ctc n=1 Tax=Allorhizocola rhizosphaerae TaxID=1872709 RepID=UPI000E3B6600|nr:50S ribosomal protein L25/general stress protein Ctc [Allorhizocola rhizosphaerae]